MKRFPVMLSQAAMQRRADERPSWSKSQPTPETVQFYPGTIPWEMAERAYQDYSRRNGTSQSLERLAERGGFSHGELIMHGLTAAEVCAALERPEVRR